ncbi:hypothetical protein BO71DRAFT_395225 [Aspergillus ellipticus CBS 707.79]|uniref:Uncharacterized protein n=1 Tax=Aspergillus ellipticus CBS 707.79 TaxID=1448320 RepID=A0A319DLK8_9EURO|nr:hypothetical protein BO71DRAFT_395225 [Aspergillus ellipticus CBS 707.79]
MAHHSEKLIDLGTEQPSSPVESGVLNPLLFLLAARRGIETDPSLPPDNIPLDSGLSYRGDSGVKTHSPLCPRLICEVGRLGFFPKLLTLCVIGLIGSIVTAFSMLAIVICSGKVPFGLHRQADIQLAFILGGMITAVASSPFVFLTGVYVRRHDAAAIAPQFDPNSYQSRLATAMSQHGLLHKEMVTATREEVDKDCSKNGSLFEKFTISKLVDPQDRRFVHDVVVRFFANGQVWLQFKPESYAQPAMVISCGHTQPVMMVPHVEEEKDKKR